jgi:hypothetical protein
LTREIHGFDSPSPYQMFSIESYDGLCGIIANFSSSDLRMRCKYELGHSGLCSFEKYKKQFRMTAGAICNRNPCDDYELPDEGGRKKFSFVW